MNQKKLTIFDLDNTILNGNSDHSWLEYLILNDFIYRKDYEPQNKIFHRQFIEGNMDFVSYYEFNIQYLCGQTDNYIHEIRQSFLRDVIEPMINIYALKLVHEQMTEDTTLLLATGTTSILAKPIADRLGFKHLVSTELEMKKGYFTGKVIHPPALGSGKFDKVLEWMKTHGFKDFSHSTFYTDSILDIDLMRAVETPIAVNPDKDLEQECFKQDWQILELPVHQTHP